MWSNDPSKNLVLAQELNVSSGQTNTTICPAHYPIGFYVAWLDAVTGYSIYIQRLDVNGNAMWREADTHVGSAALNDYCLGVDTAGNALLGFNLGPEGSTTGGPAIGLKISPTGAMLWGSAGIQLSASGEQVGKIRCAGTSDGGVAFGWSTLDGLSLHFVKFDSNSAAMSGIGVIYAVPGAGLMADIQASDSGSVIYSVTYAIAYAEGNMWALHAQKLASLDGAYLWGHGRQPGRRN
jgi:hypothetical protein